MIFKSRALVRFDISLHNACWKLATHYHWFSDLLLLLLFIPAWSRSPADVNASRLDVVQHPERTYEKGPSRTHRGKKCQWKCFTKCPVKIYNFHLLDSVTHFSSSSVAVIVVISIKKKLFLSFLSVILALTLYTFLDILIANSRSLSGFQSEPLSVWCKTPPWILKWLLFVSNKQLSLISCVQQATPGIWRTNF